MPFLCIRPHSRYMISAITTYFSYRLICPVFQRWKIWLKVINQLAQDYAYSQWRIWDLKLETSSSETFSLHSDTLYTADFYALDSVDFTLILKHLSQGWEIKWNWLFDTQIAAKYILWNADVIQIPKVFVFYPSKFIYF